MNSYISILGLYQYDPTLFEMMILPEGLDHETAVNEIMLRCADLEILYPDARFMKTMIHHWSIAHEYSFEKMYKTTQLSYNPIWNKDGVIIEETETGSTAAGTTSVKGFNSDAWADSMKTDGRNTGNAKTTRTETGNIGVTTTQQMIREERDISDFNIYGYIADSFKNEFCILVY